MKQEDGPIFQQFSGHRAGHTPDFRIFVNKAADKDGKVFLEEHFIFSEACGCSAKQSERENVQEI